jgi:uncharacterized protein
MSGLLPSARRQRQLPAPTAALAAIGFVLAACAPAGPPPVTYVLGAPAAAREEVEPLTGRPAVEVAPVLVPDYLDVADILVRRAENVMAPLPTGRWGERLSVGATRAVAAGLARRLPEFIVTTTASAEPPAGQVLVDIETFEARADGTVVLVARWRVLEGDGREMLAGERVSLTEPVTGQADADMVAAMSRAVERLTDRVAAGIQRSSETPAGT